MSIENKLQSLLNGESARELFARLYGSDTAVIEGQIGRYLGLVKDYMLMFPETRGDIHLFSTSGRTEIGGNHTDHNNGRVLAAAVNLDSVAVAERNDTDTIILYSRGFSGVFRVELDNLEPKEGEQETTTALIRGIASRFRQLGYKTGGFNAYLASDVLKGSGLSSSASIEVLVGTIMSALYNEGRVDPKKLAKIGQYAENVYFNKPCGLMDQMACAVGGFVAIDFKDPENPVVSKIEFDLARAGYSLLVVDTGGNHADLTRDYADVPREMKSVAAVFGKSVLRDLSVDDVLADVPSLRQKVGDRAILRALHFFSDNERAASQAAALEKGDFNTFLELVNESGSSSWRLLQNVYTNQNPAEQGVTLALAITERFIRQKGAGACRVHGGGFAGTIQAYIRLEDVDEYISIMNRIFGDRSITVLGIRPYGTLHLNPLLGE